MSLRQNWKASMEAGLGGWGGERSIVFASAILLLLRWRSGRKVVAMWRAIYLKGEAVA